MKKRIVLLFIEIFIFIIMLGLFMNTLYSAKCAVGGGIYAVSQTRPKLGADLEKRMQPGKVIEKAADMIYRKNPVDALFYGEWELTDVIYVNPILAPGIPPFTEKEAEEFGKEYIQGIREEGVVKVQFLQNAIMINGEKKYDCIYEIIIFPSREYQRINYNMLLSEMGMTEEAGRYYAFVTADWDEEGENKYDSVLYFYIKDENTLLMNYSSCCVEYRRTSYVQINQDK